MSKLESQFTILALSHRISLDELERRQAKLELAFYLLNALLWVLPNAGFSGGIVQYSKRVLPQVLYQHKPGLVRRVRKCLDTYASRVLNAKLKELEQRIEDVHHITSSAYRAPDTHTTNASGHHRLQAKRLTVSTLTARRTIIIVYIPATSLTLRGSGEELRQTGDENEGMASRGVGLLRRRSWTQNPFLGSQWGISPPLTDRWSSIASLSSADAPLVPVKVRRYSSPRLRWSRSVPVESHIASPRIDLAAWTPRTMHYRLHGL
ncbi:hypothetical protein D9619_011044 [Psilocybe cf. subviscida]|uniref:Uncharacterized protein n=1 Tax=Psilocybe cf. subviscida TaxID=2480587 RepID=A0A8H5B8S8_9AGAR|nr:hypothetical protein D9619_011044 [Psilocybe cf. subviscida]